MEILFNIALRILYIRLTMLQNYAKNSANSADPQFLYHALQWYMDNGVDELLLDVPTDRTVIPEIPKPNPVKATKTAVSHGVAGMREALPQQAIEQDMMGTAQAIVEAKKLAQSC